MLLKKSACWAAVAALTLFAAPALIAAPKIELESESLDLGKVVCGKPVDAVFTLKNTVDSDLEITGIRTGCGCTKADVKQKKLAPGESRANRIINHPWNLLPTGDTTGDISRAIHGVGDAKWNIGKRMWRGTPAWFKYTIGSIAGRLIPDSDDNPCP